MKTTVYKFFALLLMLMSSTAINAQEYEWAIVTKNIGDEKPVVTDYYSFPETAINGIEYVRIQTNEQLEDGLRHFVSQQYGMREADGKLYVYDFENEKEMVAFDFNLSVGDEFTTLNGIQWQVEDVADTLIRHEAGQRSHRRLTVKSKDGKWTDQWLEGIGSFANHLMIMDLSEMEFSYMPWFMYQYGAYIAREFSCDPIFGHDTGMMPGHYDDDDYENRPTQTISFKDGILTFIDYGLRWPARYYELFYRDGDNLYCLKSWYLLPYVESATPSWKADKFVFTGLPAPASGSYTLHVGGKDISTHVPQVKAASASFGSYDMQGRKATAGQRGVVIERHGDDVRKVVNW